LVNGVVVADTTVWVATAAGVYRNSAVQAGPWSSVNSGLGSLDVTSLAALQGKVYCVAAGAIYGGGENGAWSDVSAPSYAYPVRGARGRLLASTSGGILRPTATGWQLMPHARPPGVNPGPAGGVMAVDVDDIPWAGNSAGLWRNVSYTDPDSLYWRNYRPSVPVGNNFVT